jgi:glycosyltransferase involved in cell wall biosynthesis
MISDNTVAVVIPFFDQHEFVDATIASVARQSRPVDEVIVVDDGSSMPFEGRHAHAGLSIRVHRQDNGGLAQARNAGFRLTAAKYVVPLDADDVLHEDFVAETLRLAEATAAPYVYCDIETFGDESKVYRHPVYDFARLCRGNFIVATSLISKATFDAVRRRNGHGYDPAVCRLGGYEDYLFYIEAGAMGLYGVHLPAVLFKYRRREGSMLGRARARVVDIRAYMREKVLREYGIDIGHVSSPGEP